MTNPAWAELHLPPQAYPAHLWLVNEDTGELLEAIVIEGPGVMMMQPYVASGVCSKVWVRVVYGDGNEWSSEGL